MEALILDQNYDAINMVDVFESFIWTDRFLGYGDFEIYTPIGGEIPLGVQIDNYVTQKNSDRYMIIEDILLRSNVEEGVSLTVSGRSLESILERRIIWGQKVINGNFQQGIKTLIDESIINPTMANRKIPNFTFRQSNNPAITNLTISAQFIGDNLYDAIFILCESKQIGFRVLPNYPGGFIFELFTGIDRSYSQEANSHVVFSPKFENLLESNYLESNKALKTAALVAGQGEGPDQVMVEAVVDGGRSGLNRREIFVQASGISTKTDDGELTPEEYNAQLKTKGIEELSKTNSIKSFEGEIDATIQYVYGQDFFVGDIVQVVNEFGMEASSRVSELVQTHNKEGESFIPTFVTVEI